jgi:hypothetical protein
MNLHNTSLGVFVPGRSSTRSLRTPFNAQMGDFVPASFPIPQVPITLGDFVGGSFPVPFNPIAPSVASAGIGDFVPANFPIPQVPIKGGGMGYFMDACFPVPQNPIADAAHVVPATAINGRGMGRIGCTSCGGTCGGKQMNTRAVQAVGSSLGDIPALMTDIATGDWYDAAMGNDLWSGIPNIVIILGGTWLIASIIGDLRTTTRKTRAVYHATKKAVASA